MEINRREALKSFLLIMGGTMVGSQAILTGCSPKEQIADLTFSPETISLLDELGEAIIPTTSTPGAKAAGIGEFMRMMVTDTYEKENQEVFIKGIQRLQEQFQSEYSKAITAAETKEITAFLNAQRSSAEGDDARIFGMLKDLTVLGYFTSEVGATQQLRYVEVPGKYDGCLDYKKGDRVFAI